MTNSAAYPTLVYMSVAVPDHVHHVEDDLKHVIVMNVADGRIFGLDNSAAVMWQTLASSGSPDAAAAAVVERYGISQEQATSDVERFVSELCAAGLLVSEPSDA